MLPNIVWVNCDQLRWDAVGYAGNPVIHTPNIDRLAARGVWFDNAYCASPVCSPARASMLTGLYPHAHRQFINCTNEEDPDRYLAAAVPTIGDLLRRHGYACGNAGVWHLGTDETPQHGFDDFWVCFSYVHYRSFPGPFFRYLDELGISNPYAPDAQGVFRYGEEMPLGVLTDPRQQRSTWTVDRALEFLERDHERPFFLLVGLKDPHPPIIPPQELLARYPLEELPFPANFHDPLAGKPRYQQQRRCRVPPGSITVEDFRTVIRYYYALVTHVDHEIGRLVEFLKRRGTFDETIFVVNSDHGEMLGNHGFVEKCLMYEESVRVPCLISWPAQIPAGQRVAAPFGGVDLTPTLLELAGAPIPEKMDGRSVAADLLAAAAPQAKPVFAEIASGEALYRRQHDPAQFAAHVMVRDGGWKYVWNRFDDDELYHLDADPAEMHNLAPDPACGPRIRALRELIVAMLATTGPGLYDWCLHHEGR